MMRRILLLEDEALDNILIQGLFVNPRTEVTSVKTGAAALEVTRRVAFDWILMELKLPDISGSEVIRLMRKRGVSSRILIVSVATRLEEREEG